MRLASLLVVISLGCAVAACGGDNEESAAQRCNDSWNADANQGHQASLAGAVSAVELPPDAFRVGTWPKAQRAVPVHSPKAAFAGPDGRAVVPKGSCLIIVPPSREGEMTFFEGQGKWQFVRSVDRTRFPAEARRSVADAEEATADAVGKLTLK